MTVSLKVNGYVQAFLSAVSPYPIKQLVCYGLGPICRSVISQHQLAVLLVLSKNYPIVYCFDPVFDKDDLQVLQHFRILQCEYPDYPNRHELSLLYMPHCEVHVYDGILKDPSNIILFGNRIHFSNEHECSISSKKLPNQLYPRQDVFNDCFLHFFTLKDDGSMSSD